MTNKLAGRLPGIMRKKKRRIIGLMSGTSADGLDIAVTDIENRSSGPAVSVCATGTAEYPPALRRRIHEMMEDRSCSWEKLVRLHYQWSAFAAAIVREFLDKHKIGLTSIDAVASHGQTVAHYPRLKRQNGFPTRGTFQVGDPAVLANLSGFVTIGDFRWSDIGAGGEGAPLSGYYHHLMLARLGKKGGRTNLPPAVLNIGGMSNISVGQTKRGKPHISAFDTGPGNCLSDGVMRLWGKRRFDRGGKLAARGIVDQPTLRQMERHSFFRRRPPKSCGREEFGVDYVRKWYPKAPKSKQELSDRLATVDELTARSITAGIRWLGKIGGIIVVGGGRHNHYLRNRLSELVAPIPLVTAEALGLPGDYIEAIGFALLANETLSGRHGNLGGASGAHPAVLGKICLPG